MKTKTFYKSKSRQNIMNFKNEYFFSKYSNSTLFKKREEQLESKKSKTIYNTKELYNNKNINSKKKSNLQLSPKTLTKTDSFPFLLSSLSSYRTFNTTATISKKNSLKKSPSMNYTPHSKIPTLCLTEEELINKNIIFNSEEPNYNNNNNESKFKNKRFSKIFQTDIFLKTPEYNDRKKIGNDNIEFLLNLKEEVDKFKKSKMKTLNKVKELKDLKEKNLNKREFGTKKLIKKTKSYKFLQFLTKTKKERYKSIDEEYQTKIDSIQEKINSREEYLKLFNRKFIKKLGNYIKYLDDIRENEKRKNIRLFKEKIEYKQKIAQLEVEIEKMELKKNQIIKWVYLQMQVKEKKLVLPNYYKRIIESNKSQILAMQAKYERDRHSRDSKNSSNKSGSSKKKKVSIKRSISSSLFKKFIRKDSSEKSLKGKIINIQKEKENINSSNKMINIGLNNSIEFITKDDFDKILFWKYSPIFKTAEEFIDSLKQLDTQNIYLLKYYNKIQSKIYDSLKELRKIINSKNKSEIIENQIKEKTNKLEKLNNRYKYLYKIYSNLKQDKNPKRKSTHDSTSINPNVNIISINIDIIYHKINDLYKNCKLINNINLLETLDYNIKKANNKEEEIIYIMEYIECTIDYLLEKRRYYKRDENKNDLLQKIINDIDKYHKMEKPDKQRLEDFEKSLQLLEKIKNKNNKLFLRHKKVDYYFFNMKNKKGLDNDEVNKNKDDFPTLDEFLNNVNMINDIYPEKKVNRRESKKKTSKRKKDNNI